MHYFCPVSPCLGIEYFMALCHDALSLSSAGIQFPIEVVSLLIWFDEALRYFSSYELQFPCVKWPLEAILRWSSTCFYPRRLHKASSNFNAPDLSALSVRWRLTPSHFSLTSTSPSLIFWQLSWCHYPYEYTHRPEHSFPYQYISLHSHTHTQDVLIIKIRLQSNPLENTL